MPERMKARVYGVLEQGERVIVHYLVLGTDFVIEKCYNLPSAGRIRKNMILHVSVPENVIKKLQL